MDKPIRLLIKDSQTEFTAILAEIILSDPRIEIVGLAQDRLKICESDNLEKRITTTLNMLGIPAHIKGFRYVHKAIAIVTEDRETIDAVTKILYPCVAKIYNTTPSCVERAIRHAIEVAWDRGDVDTLNRIFGYTVSNYKGKPTNSEFIAGIVNHLQMQMGNTL